MSCNNTRIRVVAATLLLAGCAGEVVVEHDAGPAHDVACDQPATDGTLDAAPRDAALATEGAPLGDQGAGGDAPGPCSAWANWTCQTDPVYRCKAQCVAGGATLLLSCVNTGQCVCGVSISACGPFGGGADPCDSCREAVEQGCCD